jgi:ABC-type branched-chain amino acid transport systems, ATPase component
MLNPQIILLDEPTAGLSPKIAQRIYEYISNLKREGKTLILTEQNVKEGINVADYVYVLEQGTVTNQGPKRAVEAQLESIVASWLLKK